MLGNRKDTLLKATSHSYPVNKGKSRIAVLPINARNYRLPAKDKKT
jgi:hypothetical protein